MQIILYNFLTCVFWLIFSNQYSYFHAWIIFNASFPWINIQYAHFHQSIYAYFHHGTNQYAYFHYLDYGRVEQSYQMIWALSNWHLIKSIFRQQCKNLPGCMILVLSQILLHPHRLYNLFDTKCMHEFMNEWKKWEQLTSMIEFYSLVLTSPRPKSNPNPKSQDLGCH